MGDQSIRGVVVPREWDEEGRAVAVAVLTYTEDMYGVDRNGMGKRLLDLINADVEVDGHVNVVNGTKIIRVTNCRIRWIWR